MNCPPIAEQISPNPLESLEHPSFTKEAARISGRFASFEEGFKSAKKIIGVHFHPLAPKAIIAPGKLHRVKDCDTFVVWKLEMAVRGLRANQFPRVWFALRGSVVAFLILGTHVDNYVDGEMDAIAEARAHDLF